MLYLRLCTAVLAVLISPQVRAVARLCAIILLLVVVTKKIVEICQVDSGARKGTCRVEDTALLQSGAVPLRAVVLCSTRLKKIRQVDPSEMPSRPQHDENTAGGVSSVVIGPRYHH